MAHERLDGDDVPITHEALSAILGVRRSGITVATAALQRQGLIRTGPGRIHILDRHRLQALLEPSDQLDGVIADRVAPSPITSLQLQG